MERKNTPTKRRKNTYWKWIVFGLAGIFIFIQIFEVDLSVRMRSNSDDNSQIQITQDKDPSKMMDFVLPAVGVTLPVVWGDLREKLVESGVIDKEKFESLYAARGGLSENTHLLLYGSSSKNLKISRENANEILNLLWAFGLANKNRILEDGPMMDKKYGGVNRFASTGGWTVAKDDATEHYSAHLFVTLTREQQELVEKVSRNIYRPCCNNPVYFPDCNHGMAMLGLLELLAAQGVSENEMYDIALQVNSYWFPDSYLTLAKYFSSNGISWGEVDSKEVLNATYSSASGYRKILAEVEPVQQRGGEGCGV